MRGKFSPALGVAILTFFLSSCATYKPLSLPADVNLRTSVFGLTTNASYLPAIPGVRERRINLRQPLSGTDVAILAVLNDPALRAVQSKHAEAAAQLFAAGLLPDPILSFGRDYPRNGAAGSTGRQIGVTEEINAWVTRSQREHAAAEHLKSINLKVVWAGWQVAERARWLTAEVLANQRILHLQQSQLTFMQKFLSLNNTSLRMGYASELELYQLHADVANYLDQIALTRRKLIKEKQSLRKMMGLQPTAGLELRDSKMPEINFAKVASALHRLPKRRPDLLALAAAFKSADAKLRAKIAGQFPLIDIGFNQHTDVEGVTSIGFGLTLRLPFFNSNRGAIRQIEATRTALKARYQARFDEAVSDVVKLKKEYGVLSREAPTLKRVARNAHLVMASLGRLVRTGDISEAKSISLALRATHMQRRNIQLRLQLRKTAIAIQTVLGVPPRYLYQQLQGNDHEEHT